MAAVYEEFLIPTVKVNLMLKNSKLLLLPLVMKWGNAIHALWRKTKSLSSSGKRTK